jgi:hypothetical protein
VLGIAKLSAIKENLKTYDSTKLCYKQQHISAAKKYVNMQRIQSNSDNEVTYSTNIGYQVMGVFIPSTQHHYRKLILLLTLLVLLHVSVVQPSSGRNILLARITQLTTDPLFLEYS